MAEMVCDCREVVDLRTRLAEVEAERGRAVGFAAQADIANTALGARLAAVLALCANADAERDHLLSVDEVRAAAAGDDRGR